MPRVYVLLLLPIALLACQAPVEVEEPSPQGADVLLDQDLLRAAERIDGFGGMYFDDDGTLTVLLVADPSRAPAESPEAQRSEIEAALSEVLGEDFLRRGQAPRTEREDKLAAPPPATIKLAEAQYEILQLATWRRSIDTALAIPGVVFTDLDERSNRLKIGFDPAASREQIEQSLQAMDIPRAAIVLEETQPIHLYAGLRSKHRSMPAGVQVAADTGFFRYKFCTMGFNARRANVAGFVTNSHCTDRRSVTEGTDFHQPDESWWSELTGGSNRKVGDEIADPPLFVGGDCPAGRRCRYSDSAFVDYRIARGQDIARTTGWNNGSLTIDDDSPRLRIIDEANAWLIGSELDKIGRTTGWTYGVVTTTCASFNVFGTDLTMLCQGRVARKANQTHSMVGKGDSGSPVFVWQPGTAELSGILWGGPEDGSSFVFSPIDQIEAELGPLTTFDFPPRPERPRMCPSGQRCCEPMNPDGTCPGLCWPVENPCP